MSIGSLIQILMAIPKIISALNEFFKAMDERAKAKEKIAHDEAMRKLKDAKTEEDQKNALRDLVKHP